MIESKPDYVISLSDLSYSRSFVPFELTLHVLDLDLCLVFVGLQLFLKLFFQLLYCLDVRIVSG